MRVLYIIDAPSSLNPKKDSTIALMRASAQRGDTVYCAQMHDISQNTKGVFIRASQLVMAMPLADNAAAIEWMSVISTETTAAQFFDLIWMRKEPPVNDDFIMATRLLDVVNRTVPVVNSPIALQQKNEKLAIFDFPQYILPTWVGSSLCDALDFHKAHQSTVMKPLDGMGGQGIYVSMGEDKNFYSVFETLSQQGQKRVMLQHYSDKIIEGDCRIFVVGGVVYDWMLARIPNDNDHRGNMAAGGQPVAKPLDDAKRKIAEAVAPQLMKDGIFFAGLDIIGNSLIEINITCPTGLNQVYTQTGNDVAVWILEQLDRYLSR